MEKVLLYTDGSHTLFPGRKHGPGAYAALLIFEDGREIEIVGGSEWSTAHRAELQAAVAGFRALIRTSFVTWHTDNDRLAFLVTQERETISAVNDFKLTMQLRDVVRLHKVSVVVVEGHGGDPLHDRVDQLARAEVRRLVKEQVDRNRAKRQRKRASRKSRGKKNP